MREKVRPLRDAIDQIPDGVRLALGGNTLHRAPCAAIHELIRQGRRELDVIKTAGSYDIDVLAAADVLSVATAGYVGYENVFGDALAFRRAVEAGSLRYDEHSSATIIAGLRAATQGVPFMPIAGIFGSDLMRQRPDALHVVQDPFTGQPVVAVRALVPDFAIIHVSRADAYGNAVILGSEYEDLLLARAAKRLIVTTEEIVPSDTLVEQPELVHIPGFLVESVVFAPRGAWPTSCGDLYSYDEDYLTAFTEAAADPTTAAEFIAQLKAAQVSPK